MKLYGWVVAVLLLMGGAIPAGAQRRLHVQVRTTPVRQSPSFLAPPVSELQYGDRIHVEREQGPWVQVRHSENVAGRIHASALTRRRVRLLAGEEEAAVTATGDELAFAGKGFNEQVEEEFRTGDAQLDYTWVDRAEEQTILPEVIRRFLVSGGLRDPARGEER